MSLKQFNFRLIFCYFSAAGGKLVEPTPETERELAAELEKVAKQYGGGEGVNMTQFPTFQFKGEYGKI